MAQFHLSIARYGLRRANFYAEADFFDNGVTVYLRLKTE